jgi:hypothetical protein
MSEIFSVQLTAVFTAILGAGAIVTAVLAALAFRKQSQEVGLLLEQNSFFLEQNKRDTDERRRAQAARVFLGAPPDEGNHVSPYVRNASDFPVYGVRIRYYESGKLSDPEKLGTVMPGDFAAAKRQFPTTGKALEHTILTFRDAAGLRWVRMPDGEFWESSYQDMSDRAYIGVRFMAKDLMRDDDLDVLPHRRRFPRPEV